MTGETPTDTEMFTPFVGNDTQMSVIATPGLPSYASPWVATVAGMPFKSFDTDANPRIGSAPSTTSAPAGGFASQLIAVG